MVDVLVPESVLVGIGVLINTRPGCFRSSLNGNIEPALLNGHR